MCLSSHEPRLPDLPKGLRLPQISPMASKSWRNSPTSLPFSILSSALSRWAQALSFEPQKTISDHIAYCVCLMWLDTSDSYLHHLIGTHISDFASINLWFKFCMDSAAQPQQRIQIKSWQKCFTKRTAYHTLLIYNDCRSSANHLSYWHAPITTANEWEPIL